MGRKHLTLVLEDKIYPQKRRLLRPGTVNVIYFCTKSYSIQFKIPKKLKKKKDLLSQYVLLYLSLSEIVEHTVFT